MHAFETFFFFGFPVGKWHTQSYSRAIFLPLSLSFSLNLSFFLPHIPSLPRACVFMFWTKNIILSLWCCDLMDLISSYTHFPKPTHSTRKPAKHLYTTKQHQQPFLLCVFFLIFFFNCLNYSFFSWLRRPYWQVNDNNSFFPFTFENAFRIEGIQWRREQNDRTYTLFHFVFFFCLLSFVSFSCRIYVSIFFFLFVSLCVAYAFLQIL